MERLKNCPNCGGILDDEGRCMYCKSKVYDLTGMTINLDSRDIVLLKVKYYGHDVIMKGYPTNLSLTMNNEYDDVYSKAGAHMVRVFTGCDITADLQFQIVATTNEDKNIAEINI